MRVLKHVGSLGRPAVCGRSAIEAKPRRSPSHADVRNDGRGTAIATLLATRPMRSEVTAAPPRCSCARRMGGPCRTRWRRIFYNIAVTTLSVALAMILGTVLLLQMAARALGLSNGFWGPVQSLDLGHLG
jgi:hypothetical protein